MPTYEYSNPLLRKAQSKRFRGLSPSLARIRAAAGRGYTEIGLEEASRQHHAFLKTAKATDVSGLVWDTRVNFPFTRGSLNVPYTIESYLPRFNIRTYSSGLKSIPIPDLVEKSHLTNWLSYGRTNRNFSKSARSAFDWALEHTTASYNLGDVYSAFGVRSGKRFLERGLEQKFEDMVFRYSESSRGEGVWLGLKGLSKRKKMAFTGRSRSATIPFTHLSKDELAYQKIMGQHLDAFRQNIMVSKKLNLAQEYRVVFAGGEAVDITYRWGSKGARELVEDLGLSGAIKKLGVKSGLPEIIQPVSKKEAELLGGFTKKYAKVLPPSVGALDIGLQKGMGLTEDALKVIEVQQAFGNIKQPWVRQKIYHRLTGKWPKEWKTGAGVGVGLAALAGGLAINAIYNKIVGHHPGRVNKETEAAIDSDFTAGRSYTRKGPKKESIPWVQHGILATAAFMTGLDRTKNIKGGLAGAAFAVGFMGLRHALTPKDSDWSEVGSSAWRAVEFSAITSLLGSSMMKGGFLHKLIGAPAQKWLNTTAYTGAMKGISGVYGSSPIGKKTTELLSKYHTLSSLGGYFEELNQDLVRKVIKAKAREGKYTGWKGFRVRNITGPMQRDVQGSIYKDISDVLKNSSGGPRGPFEVIQGIGDISERLIRYTKLADQTISKQFVDTARAAGRRFGRVGELIGGWIGRPIGWVGSKVLGPGIKKEAASLYDWKISMLPGKLKNVPGLKWIGKERSVLKMSERFMPLRPYFEGIFGSPVIGRDVVKYGSLRNIPMSKYVTGNIKDIFYGAAPGIALMSPVIGFNAAKVGFNKAYNKIVGHHPGWANKKTEAAIDSDFRAGSSIVPEKVKYKASKVAELRKLKYVLVGDGDNKNIFRRYFDTIVYEKKKNLERRISNGTSPVIDKFENPLLYKIFNARKTAHSNMATAVSRKLMSNPTTGLTNNVLHDRRVNHTIIDQSEKTKHLFKGV